MPSDSGISPFQSSSKVASLEEEEEEEEEEQRQPLRPILLSIIIVVSCCCCLPVFVNAAVEVPQHTASTVGYLIVEKQRVRLTPRGSSFLHHLSPYPLISSQVAATIIITTRFVPAIFLESQPGRGKKRRKKRVGRGEEL
ncbi:hypothetical protein LY76DRAFT_259710 [Colletotrichum caudatum]|nr:hypothetical protein LY76DRAFT_259710 [Colletotrichum caudatum]